MQRKAKAKATKAHKARKEEQRERARLKAERQQDWADGEPDEEELQMDDETFSQKDSKRIAKEQVMYRVGDDFEEIVNREDDIQLFPGVGRKRGRTPPCAPFGLCRGIAPGGL